MSDSIHDDADLTPVPWVPASAAEPVLKVYQTGPLTVVGFGGNDVPDEVCIAAYRRQLAELIQSQGCKVLAFDLTGVKLIPSGMLGVLVTVRKLVDRVELYNASKDIRDVLRITSLLPLFDLKDVTV